MHVVGFNLNSVMWQGLGVGGPGGLEGHVAAIAALLRAWIHYLLAVCKP